MQDKQETVPPGADLQRQVEALQDENKLMRQLGTVPGFMQAYFDCLKDYNSHKEAFEAVNAQYHAFWGVYRYSDFESFRKVKNRHFKKSNE